MPSAPASRFSGRSSDGERPAHSSSPQSPLSRSYPSLRSRELRQSPSYPFRLRAPNVLVHLQLEADIQFVAQNPFRKQDRLELSEHDGHQDRRPPVDLKFLDHSFRPVIIFPVSDDKLDLVPRVQILHVLPEVLFHHPARRTLEIDDAPHTPVGPAEVEAAAGFKQKFVPFVAQTRHQLVHGRLEQRLPPPSPPQPSH